MSENLKYVLGKVKKHCGKRRKCWLPAFSPFPTMLSKDFFLKVIKSRNCVVRFMHCEKRCSMHLIEVMTPPLSTCAIHTIFPMNLHFSPFFSWLFSTKNQRYYDSLGGVIMRISLNMCTLPKEQSILSRKTIQFFFKELCPFFNLDFLSSIKHPAAERWHLHAVLLNFFVISKNIKSHLAYFCFGQFLTVNHLTLYLICQFWGSSDSAANKDVMSKIWTNGDTIILLNRKHCGKRRNCSLRAISPFPAMFSKAV